MAASSPQKQANDPAVASGSSSPSTSLSPPPAAAPAPAQRKSRVLSRKTDHSLIERRRREKINERLIRLQFLIPACREEAQDLLSVKPPKAARGKGVSQEAKAREIERCLAQEMVLEKLCIISHSVDYILELQTQVAAYRKLCMCDPPVREDVQPRDHQLHVQYAHEGVEKPRRSQGAGSGSELEVSSKDGTTGLESPTSPVMASGAFKRKRHWGSNKVPTAPVAVPAKRSRAGSMQGTIKSGTSTRSPIHEAAASPSEVDIDTENEDGDESEEESQEAVTEPEADDEGYLAFSTDSTLRSKSRRSSDPTSAAHFSTPHHPSTFQQQQQQQQQQQYLPPFASLQTCPTGRARLRLQRVPGILSLTQDDRQWPRAYSRQVAPQVVHESGRARALLPEPKANRRTEIMGGINAFAPAVEQEQVQVHERV